MLICKCHFKEIKRSLHSLFKCLLFVRKVHRLWLCGGRKTPHPRTLSKIFLGSPSFSCTFSAIFSLTVFIVTDFPLISSLNRSLIIISWPLPGTFWSFTLVYNGNAWAFAFPTHDLAQVFRSRDGGFRFFSQSTIFRSSGNIVGYQIRQVSSFSIAVAAAVCAWHSEFSE